MWDFQGVTIQVAKGEFWADLADLGAVCWVMNLRVGFLLSCKFGARMTVVGTQAKM
jgi:hypothetical protein